MEAFQYTEEAKNEILKTTKCIGGCPCMGYQDFRIDDYQCEIDNRVGAGNKMLIPTLEGTVGASINDWIIKGVNGELYPCKPDIFEKTYDIL